MVVSTGWLAMGDTILARYSHDSMIDLILSYKCNVQCDYCTITEEMRRKPGLTTAQAVNALEKGRAAGCTQASFGGGEPTIRKDLVKLVRVASAMGYERIKISSNGLRYAYPEYVDSLLKAGANQFNISIMGWNRSMYERIMGRGEFFDLVVKGVGHLVERDAVIVADVIMKNDTYRELETTVELWAELGVEQFVLWLMSLTDRAAGMKESLVPVSIMRPFMNAAFEVGRRRGIQVFSRHIPRCMLPGYHDHVWDVRADKVFIVTPESEFWLAESRITANTHVEQCSRCVLKEECMGVRKDYLENIGSHEVVPIES